MQRNHTGFYNQLDSELTNLGNNQKLTAVCAGLLKEGGVSDPMMKVGSQPNKAGWFLQVSSVYSLLLSTPCLHAQELVFTKFTQCHIAWVPPWKSKVCLPSTWFLGFLLTSVTTEHFETDKLKIKSQQLTANQTHIE